MSSGRRQRLWQLISDRSLSEDVAISPGLMCEVCAATLAVTGVGLSIMSDPGRREPVSSTTAVSARLEELQVTLGEGPCVEAFETGGPVLVADLDAETHVGRWPAFSRAAAEAGVAALFAFPLVSGGIRVGVLDLYRDRAGELGSDEIADALIFADFALLMLLNTQAGEGQEGFDGSRDGLSGPRVEVYQATGMVSVQLAVSLGEAFARMRGYAFIHDLVLSEVASEVVARRLRFEPEERA